MYFSHSTAIRCIQHLVVKTASELHLGMEHREKVQDLQQVYFQCGWKLNNPSNHSIQINASVTYTVL